MDDTTPKDGGDTESTSTNELTADAETTEVDEMDTNPTPQSNEMDEQMTNDGTPTPGMGAGPNQGPTVNMGMMYGGVQVTGAADDDLRDVTEAATELMGNLADEFMGIQQSMDDGDDDQGHAHRHIQ